MLYAVLISVFLLTGWICHAWSLRLRLRRQGFTIAYQQAEISALQKAARSTSDSQPEPTISFNEKCRVVACAIGALAFVTFADYITGFELLLFTFYFLPVAIIAWYFGRLSIFAMSVLCGVCWWWMDLKTGHVYSNEGIRYWNAFTCFLEVAIVGWMLNRLKAALLEQERLSRQVAATLDEVVRANHEVHKLRQELQTVCAWTKRIQVGSEWVPMEDYLRDHLQIRVTHGMSPEAQKEFFQGPKAESES